MSDSKQSIKCIDPRSGGTGEEWRRRNNRVMIRSDAGRALFRMCPMPLIYRTTLSRHVLLLGDATRVDSDDSYSQILTVPVKHHGDWAGCRPGFPMG